MNDVWEGFSIAKAWLLGLLTGIGIGAICTILAVVLWKIG